MTPFFSGMAALDSRASGKMGLRAVVYYTTTTVIAVFIGIIMVLIIHPGKGSKDEFAKQPKIEQISTADAFLDLIRCPHTHTQTHKYKSIADYECYFLYNACSFLFFLALCMFFVTPNKNVPFCFFSETCFLLTLWKLAPNR